jgi:hypothetical protein
MIKEKKKRKNPKIEQSNNEKREALEMTYYFLS